ncbi:AraC family transcriptional regulator [Tabrizicola sp.]|uniref:AraC family transcriptional regulator n=1 Tax=Tabrizicola sp. TaxID=2005166 RepID=UPI002733ED39|nr:AraC family transcriptional regulator [Tabrizicola sp.]MDP3195180.1 AraC family transcriptional regulator [Tabrizicola sp.]
MLSNLLAHGHDIRSLSPRGSVPLLGVLAEAVGYEQRRNELYSWDGLKRGTEPFLVVQHTILGEGRLDFLGARYRLHMGQTMLVTMPHAHRYWLERGGHWEYFWFILSGREALRLAREVLAVAGPVLQPGPEGEARLAEACHALLTGSFSPAQAAVLGYQALAVLHDTAFAGEGAVPRAALAPELTRVLAHVEANLGGDLRVDALAQLAGLSRAHFVRRFAAEVGVPPSDHVFARRMDRVERLLTASEMKIAEIAQATGFAEANYLAKAFRRHRGISPRDFRAMRDEAV